MQGNSKEEYVNLFARLNKLSKKERRKVLNEFEKSALVLPVIYLPGQAELLHRCTIKVYKNNKKKYAYLKKYIIDFEQLPYNDHDDFKILSDMIKIQKFKNEQEKLNMIFLSYFIMLDP